jgi:hypothetical protein
MKKLIAITFLILFIPALARGFPPASPTQAKDSKTDTSNFDGNLSGTDTKVQTALETLDDVVGVGDTTETNQDDAWAAVGGAGTETLITVTYQDATNDVDFVVNNDLNAYDWTNVDATDLKTGSVTQAWDADLDALATPTAWRMFYSDAGDPFIQEIALGADGTFLESNGAAAAPAFRALVAGDIPDISATYQPLEATLTDIADGTIAEDLVNTANPWADNEVANDITLTNITQITNKAITSLSATNWRVFYSAGGSIPVELALGADGTFLESNGAAAAPAFRTLIAGDIPDLSGTYQPLDADLTDLADGELTGSKVQSNSSTAAGVVDSGSGQNAQVWKTDASGVPGWRADATGGTPAFSDITTGTNTTATMTVGAGGTVTYTSTGVINANQFAGVTSVNATEFGYINGVTSAIQTQMDANAPDDATYILQTADGELGSAQALGALASGIMYSTTTSGVVSIATEAQLETLMGLGFGASKVATSGYILVADGTDFESVQMSADATIAAGGAVTVVDDSHAHVYSNIDATTSANWNSQVSDNTGTGAWVFATAPTFTTSIAFNAVSDTIAGIENQNLLDKTAAEEISGTWEIQDDTNIVLGNDADTTFGYDETTDDRAELTTTLSAATGDEEALAILFTVNKATSGTTTGLLINMTDTASPGTGYLLDLIGAFNLLRHIRMTQIGILPLTTTKETTITILSNTLQQE